MNLSARRIAGLAALVLPLILVGCGGEDTSQMEAAVRKTVLHEHAVAAGYVFFSCKPDGETAMCENCEVTVYEKDGGLTGYATHWSHKLRLADGKWRVVVSGERGDQKYEAASADAASANAMFDEGRTWCEARGKGTFEVLKQPS